MTQTQRRPRDPARWEQRYEEGALPWDNGKPDAHLNEVISSHGIVPGKALEIGCGTGTNAIWLAGQGYEMTGMDISRTAIGKAETKVAEAGVACRFVVGDFLADDVQGAPFGFVYDRGCLHVFDEAEDRTRFAQRVSALLEPGGIWHSLIGSTDGPPRDTGPPRRSAVDIANAVEPYFEILELKSTIFDPASQNQARAWVLVARCRTRYPA